MRYKIMIALIMLCLLCGCIATQDKMIYNCLQHNETSCAAEKCIVGSLIGYTGYDQARANYFQCLYINELARRLSEGKYDSCNQV